MTWWASTVPQLLYSPARVTHQAVSANGLRRDFSTLERRVPKSKAYFEMREDEEFWFPRDSFVSLRNILQVADLIASSINVLRVFWLALVRTVREVSYLRENEYKLHRMDLSTRTKHRPDAYAAFLSHCGDVIEMLTMVSQRPGRYRVVMGDIATTSVTRRAFSALVSSPPYGDSASTVGYGQFSRVPLFLLRHSEAFCREYGSFVGVNLDGQCLGGAKCASPRTHFELPSSLPKDVAPSMVRFSSGYFARLALLSEVLKQNALCCLVLGNRTHRGRRFPLIETTIEFLEKRGFALVDRHDRLLSRKRLPRSMRHRACDGLGEHDSINYESVVTLVR